MLRHASCDNATVLSYMLDVIDVIGQEIVAPEHRQLLLDHARLIELESRAGALIEPDRQRIRQQADTLAMALAAVA
jgi:hypothetical protein